MKGQVKWYNGKKGFGFITADNGVDHWFHIKELPPQSYPSPGDSVEFTAAQGEKGPVARQVRLEQAHSRAEHRHDSRVTCIHCGKSMVPRIVTGPPLIHGKGSWTPVPKYSLCPFCGQKHQTFPPSTGERIGQIVVLAIIAAIVLSFGFSLLR